MRIAEADIRRVFQVSLWLKGLHSLVEVLGGLALVFLSHELIVKLATARTRAELMEGHCQIKLDCYSLEEEFRLASCLAAW